MRIAVGGFLHETNTFAPSKATWDDFAGPTAWPGLLKDFTRFRNSDGGAMNIPAAGFIEAATKEGAEIVPLLWTIASPSAHVTADAYERITAILLNDLAAQLPVDAVYLDLHGAMVTEHLEDGEGELLERVKRIVGPSTLVVASLDLHANVSSRMVDFADLMVAFRTYPHVDMAETGRRTFNSLMKIAADGHRPFKAFRQLPFLIPLSWQSTEMEPARSLYAELDALEMQNNEVLCVSIATGFPAADIPDCAPSVWAYAQSQEVADATADQLFSRVHDAEPAFAGRFYTPEEAIDEALTLLRENRRPIVIADTQDNPGAGGNSDTTGLLRTLVERGVSNAILGFMVDADAATQAHSAGAGATIDICLGGRSGTPEDAPFEARFVVERISDGHVSPRGPYYAGTELHLGPTAALRIGGVRVAVTTSKVQMADRDLFRCAGIQPEEADIIVVKSSAHFRADFNAIAASTMVCVAPGPMLADPAALPWKRLPPDRRLAPLRAAISHFDETCGS